MPTPTTAIEISMMMEEFNNRTDSWRNEINKIFFLPMWRIMQRRIILQRPYTDDMMQMLVDLGIEPPDKHRLNLDLDGLTFKWR